MNIAIIANGQSALKVNWTEQLKNKDLIVRLNLGTVNNLYPKNSIIHNACISGRTVFKSFSSEQQKLLLDSYDTIYFLTFLGKNIGDFKLHKKIIFKNLYNDLRLDNILKLFNINFYNKIKNLPFKNSALYNPIARKASERYILSDNIPFLIPSTGLGAIIFYRVQYPDASIYLYGYDFNRNTGWYWDHQHNHNFYSNHDFEYEKKFIKKELSFFKNTFIMDG